MSNIVIGIRGLLLADAGVQARVDGGVHKYELKQEIDGTGTVAVVVQPFGAWDRSLHTAVFPRVRVLIHADPTRNAQGFQTADDAHDRAMAAWGAVDRVLHRPTREVLVLPGGVWLLGSERETEPTFLDRAGETVELVQVVYDVKAMA